MTELSVVSHRNLHRMVVHELGSMIVTGTLAEGAQINPDEVGRSMDASRTAVREALRVLEAKGMVRPRPKTGTKVLGVEHWDLLDEDVISWRVRGPDRVQQLTELMDLRVAVETAAVRSCCTAATQDEVDQLLSACELMREAGESGDLAKFTEADIEFHARLLSASGNRVFGQFVGPFRAVLHAREDLATLPQHISPDTIALHIRVAELIAARDTDAAESAAKALIQTSRDELFRRLADDAS
jgi:DNA-binding FadR family transcriptional regulator